MVDQLDEDELRHLFEGKGVEVTPAAFFHETDTPLNLGDMLLGGGGIDVEVRYEMANFLEFVIH